MAADWKKVKVGDRVGWFAHPETTGTITAIYLTEHPFYVVWDKGNDDWYKGEDLVFLEPVKKKGEFKMADILVCRRVEDNPGITMPLDECSKCRAKVFVEGEPNQPEKKVCIHCAVTEYPQTVLFVELPPDEFGARSLAVGIQEVYAKDNGQWHKGGVWHNQKWVLARQE